VTEEVSEARERHATNLELFLDLVFVFAVTQVASVIGADPSGVGTAKGLLLGVLVWWQWSQFTWTGSAVNLQENPRTRVLVLFLIPVTLLMTTSIPDALEGSGVWFGLSYFGVQALILGVLGAYTVFDARLRPGYLRYVSFAMLTPFAVLVGGFAHGHARIAFWCVAVVLNLLGALRAAGGEWVIDPVHFAERHALFIIIALGEVLVTAGAVASEDGLHRANALAMVAAVAVACMLWWAYFAFIPDVGERVLRHSTGTEQGRFARDLFTFGHFPLAFGIILYAVVVKHLVARPTDRLSVDDRWLLALSVVVFVGGLLALQRRVAHTTAWERVAAIVVGAGIAVLARWLRGEVAVALIAVVYAAMQSITWHRIRGFREG
jgi:low temperature requirement protein LtrA